MSYSELLQLKGVGVKTVEALNRAGLFHYEDICFNFPKKYEKQFLSELANLDDGNYHYIKARVDSEPKIAYIRKNMQIISFFVTVEGLRFPVKIYNQRYVMRIVRSNPDVVLYAKVHDKRNELVASKVMHAKNFDERVVPIYRIEGISDNKYINIVEQCLSHGAQIKEYLPEDWLKKHQLLDLNSFIHEVHQPSSVDALDEVIKRLKYREMFLYQLKVHIKKYLFNQVAKKPKVIRDDVIDTIKKGLPFELTLSQHEVLEEILNDLRKPHVMQRMLQGDTGSGKTIVALLAMIAVMDLDYQVAFMAPTEILAEQHYHTFKRFLQNTPYTVELLTGSMFPEKKRIIERSLKDGTCLGVVGTHTLFSERMTYKNLGLVITDEQHRFGVAQREQLKSKGNAPDVLYLSATPIPRTLAMTLFGDMDVSTLKSMPKNRKRIATQVVKEATKSTVRQTMLDTLKRNEQIYIVSPMIETNKELGIFGVKTIYEVVKKRYPKARVALLHAKMESEQKTDVLRHFTENNIDILVSTTVIEVGIDVANATLMVVYHAERFGYAQLHQLRGRVGRSGKAGTCLLLYEGDEETFNRLALLEEVYDGFVLSEYDLKNRGFGDLVGTEQSGRPDWLYVHSEYDMDLLTMMKGEADAMVKAYQASKAYESLIKWVMKAMVN